MGDPCGLEIMGIIGIPHTPVGREPERDRQRIDWPIASLIFQLGPACGLKWNNGALTRLYVQVQVNE